jgi:hypothetical protein
MISGSNQLYSAYAVHFISSTFFAFGYVFKMLISNNKIINNKSAYELSDRYFSVGYILSILGIAVTIIQVSISMNPLVYLTELMSGRFNSYIREAYLLSSSQGGLSGIIKMFHSVPLAVYLLNMSILTFLNTSKNSLERVKKMNKFLLILLFIKVLFSLDRLTIMGIVSVNVYVMIREKRMFKVRNILLLIITLIVGEFLSKSRLEGYGLFEFLMLYGKLGINNLQLMIDSINQYTYGFSTILFPISFIIRFFGIDFISFESNYVWQWNPAQYMVSYAFQDFGYFIFLYFFVIGFIIRSIEYKAKYKKNIRFIAVYFLTLYCLVSFISVPVIRSIEFWLMVIVSIFMTRFISSKNVLIEE